MTIKTQPYTYSAAYSAMPLRVSDTSVYTSEQYNYLINILYDKETITGSTSVGYLGNVYTKLTSNSAHEFAIGDKVYFNDSSNNIYSGVYNVMSVPTTSTVIIDVNMSTPLTANTSLSKIIPYKISPDIEKEAKLDISNTIKDFVTQNLQDVNQTYGAPNTVFEYELLVSDQKKYVFEFEDNAISGFAGKVAFFNSALTAADLLNIPFQIGDLIEIEQYQQEWDYNVTFGSSGGGATGYLILSSTTINHNFSIGQQINITGQITNPNWNGPTTVLSVGSDPKYWMITTKPLLPSGTTVDEAGVVFGTPKPSYNTVASITNIYWDVTLGVVIVTNVPSAGATQPIGGLIRFADDRLTAYQSVTTITGLTAYNALIPKLNYSSSAFDPYVIQSRTANQNNFSTILEARTPSYRIERSTKSFLLCHNYSSGYSDSAQFKFYNSSNTLISQIRLNNSGDNTKDFYVPVGIDQLIAATGTTLVSGSTLATIADNVDWYTVEGVKTTTIRTNHITFQLNNDCASYDIYHLMWKDARGSWLSYPFIYKNTQATEVERKTYYQQEGTWDLTNNTFGFDTYGRGEKSFFGRSRDKMTLNTGWIEEFENALIKDLIKSTSVYVQTPDNDLIGCIIIDREFIFPQVQDDRLWQYDINIKLSSNENRY